MKKILRLLFVFMLVLGVNFLNCLNESESNNKSNKSNNKRIEWNEEYIKAYGILTLASVPSIKLEGGDVKALEFVLDHKSKANVRRLIKNAAENVDFVNQCVGNFVFVKEENRFVGNLDRLLAAKGFKDKDLEKEKYSYVQHLTTVIEFPVEKFLKNLQQPWCKRYFMSWLKRIFKKSKVLLEKSWIKKFLDSDKATTFLTDNIQNDKDLNNVCKELKSIFDSLKKTMPNTLGLVDAKNTNKKSDKKSEHNSAG